MGYTTKFQGSVQLDRKLTLKEAKFFLGMMYNEEMTVEQMVENYDISSKLQRSYLQWAPGEDLQSFVWNQEEKFYEYVEWLQFVVDRLKEIDVGVSGQITWSGEDTGDTGVITINPDWTVTEQSNYENSKPNIEPLTTGALARMAIDAMGV